MDFDFDEQSLGLIREILTLMRMVDESYDALASVGTDLACEAIRSNSAVLSKRLGISRQDVVSICLRMLRDIYYILGKELDERTCALLLADGPE